MIGIIEAGLQGACVALELAARGRRVTIFDEAHAPMTEASRWNEGKLHLGFVYANEPSLATTRVLMDGSLTFLPYLERLLEQSLTGLVSANTFVYAIMRDSMMAPSTFVEHFFRVDEMLVNRDRRWWCEYIDEDRYTPLYEIPVTEHFNETKVARAFQTPEVALDTHGIADLVSARLISDPQITFEPGVRVVGIRRSRNGFTVLHADGSRSAPFSHLVNASWRSRLLLDSELGYQPPRRWLHRYKLAINWLGTEQLESLPSCTFVLGPYGDVVNLGGGRLYLSWYPACRVALTDSLSPPHIDGLLNDSKRSSIVLETKAALGQLVPDLSKLSEPVDIQVAGGWIFAWAETDITDIHSTLHTRDDIGIFFHDNYWSINTGKYCMAPMHARRLADHL